MSGAPIVAVAVDLGSTLLKSAMLRADGTLEARRSVPSPTLRGSGEIREGDAAEYALAADGLLDDLSRAAPRGAALGVATQRSSFLLWSRITGRPLTPLVSWQDRRAAAWCVRHADAAECVRQRTGLVMTAHYVGPKLGALVETDRSWRDRLADADTLLGTLDSWLVWRRSGGATHEIDRTMAARTAMLDLDTGDWSDELLALYGIGRAILPRVRATTGFSIPLDGGLILRASVADQAAAALPLVDECRDTLIVTLGTGGFVLRTKPDRATPPPGYLLAPILSRPDGSTRWVHEGTVNGAGSAVDRFGTGPTDVPVDDPTPRAFCLPDVAGLGAPWWRPEIGLTLSDEAVGLDSAGRRRIALEGLLFRLRQIIDDLGGAPAGCRVLLAGGLAREPFAARGLAALLGRPIECVEVPDAGLLGAARLAAAVDPARAPTARAVRSDRAGTYLTDKYRDWREWVERRLEA